MWYILILFFVGIFFWNLYIKEYEDETEVEMMIDICWPIIGITISAILGLIF